MASTVRAFRTLVLPTRSLLRNLAIAAVALLLGKQEVMATHAMGGELTYACLGGNQYKVTLKFYRDCNGVAAPTNCNNGLSFNVSSANCGANFSQCFALESVQVITPICPTEIDRCSSTTGVYGVEEYTFSRIVNLSAYAGCTTGNDWVIAWNLCCRNNAITSLQSPGTQSLYLNTRLNTTVTPCNNSPIFNTDPTPYYCLGQNLSYNPGATDPDGDSLAFSIIQPRTTNNQPIPFAAGYTLSQPIRNNGGAGAVILNPITGTITCTPSIQQVAVVTYQVSEYRNGILIGTVTRDVQFVVRQCAGNSSPTATGFNGTNNYVTTVCAGVPVTLTINTSDPNAGQNTSIVWNNGIPGATFTTSGSPFQTGTFTWTPTVADIGQNLFGITVSDNACPLVGNNQYGYTVIVSPPFTPANAGPDLQACGQVVLQGVQPYVQTPGVWSVVSGTGTFANASDPNTLVSGLSPGNNVFQWTLDYSPCGTTSDQMTVVNFNAAQPSADAGPNQQLCTPSTSAQLAGNVAVLPAVGTWTLISGTGTVTNPNSPSSAVTGLSIGQNIFRWTISNGPCGAPSSDQVTIMLYDYAQPAASAGPDQVFCAPVASVTMNAQPSSGTWTVVAGTGVFANPNFRNTSVSGMSIGVNTYVWTVTNGPCTPPFTQDAVNVTVYDPNSPPANAGPDQLICANSASLSGNAPIAPATGQWILVSGSGTITTPTAANTSVTNLGVGANVFRWTLSNGPCANGLTTDQVTITRFDPAAPVANAGPDQSTCSSSPTVTMAANTPTAPSTGTWTLISGTGTITAPNSPTTTVTGLGVGTVLLQWSINNGPCGAPTTDQVNITVYDQNAVTAAAGPDQQLCTPTTSSTLAGNTPTAPSTGTWTLVSGIGTITAPASPTSAVTGLGIGVNVFRWTINNGACANPLSFDEVSILVSNNGQASASAGADQSACSTSSSATLTGNPVLAPATGSWSLVSGSGTIATPGNATTTVSGMGVGQNVFQWTIANGACGNSNDQVNVFVFDANNATANAGPDQNFCTPVGTVTLTGSNLTFPATGTWSLTSGTGTIATPNSPITSVTGITPGLNVFRWTVNNGPCGTATFDEVTINVFNSANPAAAAGPDQQICSTTTSTSMAASPAGGLATGTWTLLSGGGTITAPNSPFTTITGLPVGENVFRWTVSNGPCGTTVDQVSIFVFDANNAAANAGPDQSQCTPFTTATMAGNAPTFPATGTWTLVSGTGTITTPGSPTTSVTNLGVGTNVLRWTVNNGPCGAPTTDLVTINIFDLNAQPANAGPDQSVCFASPIANLTGNTPVGSAVGTWSVISGTGVITSPNSPNTTITGLGVGTVVVQWSINNGTCGTSNDQLTISVFDNTNPIANAGPDQSLCTPLSATDLAGSAVIFPAVGTWTVVQGSGQFANANDPNSEVTGLSVGQNILQWTVNNGPCVNGLTTDQVNIFLYDANTEAANAGPDQELCRPNLSTTMAASPLVFPAIGTWTLVSGAGTIGTPGSPTTAITELVVGDNVFRWTVNNGPCGPVTFDDVLIRVYDDRQDAATAGPDQSICVPTFPNTVVLNGMPPIYPAVGTWTLVSGTGVITSPNSFNTAVTGLDVGTNIFQWTINNGPCANPITSDQVSIFVFDAAAPVANAGPDQGLCTPIVNTVMAGSTLVGPQTGTWTLVSGSGTIVNPQNPQTEITGLGLGSNVFQWTVSNGPCLPGITSDQVSINVFNGAGQPAFAGLDQEICSDAGGTTVIGNPPSGLATGLWTVQQGSAVFAAPTQFTTNVSGLSIGVNILIWSIDNGACGVSSDPVSINVYDADQAPADAGPDQALCDVGAGVETNMAGSNIIFPGQGTWTVVSGTANIDNPTDPNTLVFGLQVGVTVLEWTVENGPCIPNTTSDQVSISVFDSDDSPAFAGLDQQFCTPTTSTTLLGSQVSFPALGLWTVVQGTGVFANASIPNTTVSGLSVGENIFQWTVNVGPCANPISSDQVSIFLFDQNNPVANAGLDQQICTPTTLTILAGSNLIAPATGQWTVVSGPGVIANPSDPSTVVSNLGVGNNLFAWTVSNGPCANSITTDQVNIILFDSNNPNAGAGPDQDLCGVSSTTTMAASATLPPATGTWTVAAGSGTFTAPSDPQSAVSGMTLGQNLYVWTVSNGTCASGLTTDTVEVNIYDDAAPDANAGTDVSVCGITSLVPLSANAPTGVSLGFWTVLSGTAALSDPFDPQATATSFSIGEVVLQWTIDNGPCGSTTDVMSIFVYDDQQVVANAGADQNICLPPNSIALNGSAYTFPSTAIWTLVSGQGTILDPTYANTTVTDLGVGENVFQWSVDNGTCTGSTTDLVSIFVFDNQAAAANAGPDQELCTPASSATLAANTPLGAAVGTWTILSGSGVLADVNDPNTTISGLSVGEVVCVWTIDNGSCGSSSDEVSIFLFDANAPVADAGPDQELCTPNTDAVMAGSAVIFPAQGTWSLIQGTGVIADINDPNTAISGLTVGVNIFQWSMDNGPCGVGVTADQVSITVFDAGSSPAAAGPDQELCSPASTTSLAGNTIISPAVGVWTLIGGTGIIVDANDPNTAVSDLSIGENIFVWTVANGPCSNGLTYDTVSVFVFDENNAVADAGPDQELCTPTTDAVMAGSVVTFPAQGTWSVLQGTGVFADVNDPNSALSGLSVGENIFQWSVSNGPCANPLTIDVVSIFLFDENNPLADAGADQELCLPIETTTLSGSSVIFPASGSWTLVGGSGAITDITDPASTVTGLGIGANLFVWTVSNGPCANGITSDTVTVFLFDNNNLGADAGSDQELCTPTSTTNLAGSAITFPAVGTWTLVSGSGVNADANDPNTGISGLVVGENIFEWSVQNGPCGAPTTDQVSIFVFDENNAVAAAGPDQDLCTPASTTSLTGSAVTFPATGTWSVVSGTASVVNVNDPNSAVVDLTIGESILVWTVSNGPCASGITTDTLSIQLFDAANPVAAAGPDQELCTPTTSAQLGGSAVTFPATGTWSLLQGSGTFADANDPNTIISDLQVGETVIRWTVSNGPCESGVSTDDLTILLYDENNLAADAGADQELCSTSPSTNISGSAVTFPATGEWTLVTGAGTIADANDPNTAVTDLAIGENIFLWTVSNGPCANGVTTDLVSIVVFDETTPVANAGADQQVCTPVTSATLAGSAVALPSTGLWTIVNGTATITDPADPNTTVTDIGIGVLTLAWTVNNGPCANGTTSDTMQIELFDLNSPPAAAGPDQEFCTPVSTAVMAANDATAPGFGVWSVAQGTATFADPSSPTTAVADLTVGENILVWTLENGVCGTSYDTVSVFIFDADNLPANAGPDVEICVPQDSIFLAGNTPTFPATGTWSLIDGAGLFEDVNDPNSKVVGLAIGANTFVWTTDNGPCANAITTDTMTVILYSDSTDAANAGPDVETCLPLTFAQLQATTPLPPASGSWTLIGGTGTIAEPTNPTTLVTDLTVGISTLIWTLDLGPCPNSGLLSDTVQIFIYDPMAPPADAGPDQELCTPNTSTTMQAATPSFPGEGTWTLVNGTGDISDVNDPTASITGLSIGLNTFVWLVYNGQCGQGPPTTDTVVIAVYDASAPLAEAGPDQQLCTPNINTTISANNATNPGLGAWTVTQGSVVFANANDPNTAVSNIAVGTNVLVWTIDNGPCGTSSDTLVIELFDGSASPADAGDDLSICIPTQPNTVNLDANAPVVPGTGSWTIISGSGVLSDATDPNTEVTDLAVGVSVFEWTIDNGPCGTSNDQVTITVHDAASPNANAGPDVQLCAPENSTVLAGNAPIFPATGAWTILSGSGVLSDPASPSASLTGLTPGITVLVWTLNNGPCANGITADTVQITVFDGTAGTADAGDDQVLCEGGPSNVIMAASNAVPPALGVWSLVSGNATIVDPSSPTTPIIGLGFGDNVFLWTVNNGDCGSSTDEVIISVFDSSEPAADAGPDQAFCQDTTETSMAAVELVSQTATGVWTRLDGTGNIITPNDPSTQVTELEVGVNVFLWTVNNGPCGTTSDSMLIVVNDCTELIIPDAFSPNGDGVNDTYVIVGLEYYPKNSILIYNRWGTLVYESSPYRNNWDGRSQADMNWGEELPEATYYYILDLGNGDEALTGFIYLKR
jgi:gliding motility-associated-like protein